MFSAVQQFVTFEEKKEKKKKIKRWQGHRSIDPAGAQNKKTLFSSFWGWGGGGGGGDCNRKMSKWSSRNNLKMNNISNLFDFYDNFILRNIKYVV